MSESLDHNPEQKPTLSVIVCRGRNKNYLEIPKSRVDQCFDPFMPPYPKRYPLGLFKKESLKRFERLYEKALKSKANRQGRKKSGFAPLKDNTLLKLIFNIYEDTTHSQITRLIGKIARHTHFSLLEYTQITPTAYEAWFFTLDLKDGKQLARYSEALSKENLMRFQKLIYETLDPQTKVPNQGMFISSKEYLNLKQIKQNYQEIEQDTTEFVNALESWFFYTQCLANFKTELEYLTRFCEGVNPFMKKYFGTLIGLKEFGGQRAMSYSNISEQTLKQIEKKKRGFEVDKPYALHEWLFE
ncbi:hypothetical protein [Helicobacter suis]|uniref:hypothetical protein n=1 Tax=Helicobacter suis TaxID=104628 RepID=UPI0013D8565E|nr:hypothetical protein [Helicobacter suis]